MSQLVGAFKPGQPQRILSGLQETFIIIERCIAERTIKAEIKPEERCEKAGSSRENLRNDIQSKGLQDRNRHKNRIKRSG